MKLLFVALVLSAACNNGSTDGTNGANGSNGTDGSNGASGTQGPQGPQGLQGAPGVAGPSGASAILLATDEWAPLLTVVTSTTGSPPHGYCRTPPDFSFTTATGHILVQRSDLNKIALDEDWLGSNASSTGMLLAARVTPNVPHTVSAFLGRGTSTIDDSARAVRTNSTTMRPPGA